MTPLLTSQKVKESLLPHLRATLEINWQSPPSDINTLLNRADKLRFLNWNMQSELSNQIATRCGSSALQAVTDEAKKKTRLNFSVLQHVQAKIPKIESVSFRNKSAYYSGRNERYAYFDGIEEMFIRKIAQDDSDGAHPLLKASRLYLDIIFFHPFDDGNSRAALLWLVFSCLRDGYPFPDLRRLVGFGFAPGNTTNYWLFSTMMISEVLKNEYA